MEGLARTWFLKNQSGGREQLQGITYAKDSRIIRHFRRLGLLDRSRGLDAEVLHIAASKDDIVVDLVGGRDLLVRVASTALGTKRSDILE